MSFLADGGSARQYRITSRGRGSEKSIRPLSRSSLSCQVWNTVPPGRPMRARVIGMPAAVAFSTCARSVTPSPILAWVLSSWVVTATLVCGDDCGCAERYSIAMVYGRLALLSRRTSTEFLPADSLPARSLQTSASRRPLSNLIVPASLPLMTRVAEPAADIWRAWAVYAVSALRPRIVAWVLPHAP